MKFKPARWLAMGKKLIAAPFIRSGSLQAVWLCGLISASGSAPVQAADEPLQETEAQRLDAVRALIGQEKSVRLFKDILSERNAAFCETMRVDLLNHKGFEPIEPIAILNTDYPEWNIDVPEDVRAQRDSVVDKKLGPALSDGIKRCSKVEADGDLRKGQALFNGFNEFFGLPPFRIYTLPARENPFKDSKLIYWSEYSEKLGRGRNGYSWVNLNICEHINGLTIAYSDSIELKEDPLGHKAALTRYKGKLVAWSVSRHSSFYAERINPNFETDKKSRIICDWSTYPLKQIN